MNPYEEEKEDNNDFPSLDSLFEDDSPVSTTNNAPEEKKNAMKDTLPGLNDINLVSSEDVMKEENVSNKPKTTAEIDIQKELEAKFDELFGALDDDT